MATSSSSSSQELPPPDPVSFWQAFWFWLKLGFISFGGPAGQISIMHQELVENRRWISEKRFLHALNYCMVLPGPEAQQLATYIGWLMHRTWGGIVAGGLFVLPSLLILMALSWVYLAFGSLLVIQGLFFGVKPAVTAIVLYAAWRIGSRALKNAWLWSIAAAAFVAIFVFHIAFPLIILTAALIGALGGHFFPQVFKAGGAHTSGFRSHGPALIDDNSSLIDRSRYGRRYFFRIFCVGLMLWILPMGLLTFCCGWEHTYTQMAWFFTKAALLTFGGAYAVLPYVYQGAVVQFTWLTPTQMMDGLALGETTPGPLIMVVVFVGFVAAYEQAIFGPGSHFISGSIAAMLVTWFTFLPSFLFILIGAPLVEATHDELKFTAPLTAITAAVVGVILNLALFFAYHVLWPTGFESGIDWLSLSITLGAAFALFAFKRVIPVLLVSAITGLILKVFIL